MAHAATAPKSWTESAYEWQQRSRRKRALEEIPHDPSSAAWAFVRPCSSSATTTVAAGTTGVSFLDAALRRRTPVDNLPVIDLRGDGCGKTWTIMTLASHFAVETRPSQFPSSSVASTASEESISLPQVLILDSTYDVNVSKLAYAVRSALLRHHESNAGQAFQRDMESCLGRINLFTVDDVAGWVPILEVIRSKLAPFSSENPTLLLWDGFLSDAYDEATRMEVVRQLARLIQECSILLVTTSSGHGNRNYEWEKYTTHRIRLDCNPSNEGHQYIATLHGSRIPYSISLSGILS